MKSINKKSITPFIFLCFLSSVVFAQKSLNTNSDNLYDVPFAELSKIQFYSANRELTDFDKVPATISVITAEEIKLSGARNLNDVLQRIPGFSLDTWSDVQPFIAHRGIKSDQNISMLLLVNGVPQNEKWAYGIHNQHMFPSLAHVKRIEIVRGSNSTLWGGDASTGVINIFTFDGEDIDDGANKFGSLMANYNYQFEDKEHVTSLQYGKKFTKGDLFISGAYANDDGDVYQIQSNNKAVNWEAYRNNIEMNLKASLGDFILTSRYVNSESPGPYKITSDDDRLAVPASDVKNSQFFDLFTLALMHNLKLNNKLKIESNLRFNDIKFDKQKNADRINLGLFYEKGIALDVLAHYKLDNWRSKLGIFGEIENYTSENANYIAYNLIGTENVAAIYGETEYTGIKNLILSAGARYMYSDLRSTGGNFMPRASAVYNINDKWGLKYSFSTGIVRPQRVYNGGDGWPLSALPVVNGENYVRYGGTREPQKTNTNELQLHFAGDKQYFTATIFQVDARNMFTWMGKNFETDEMHEGYPVLKRFAYGSVTYIRSQGVELEYNAEIFKNFRTNINFTYQNAQYKSPYITGENNTIQVDEFTVGERLNGSPDLIWNLEATYSLKKLSCNVHYRGFKGYKNWALEKTHGTINYLDANVLVPNIFKNLDLSIYGKNIFNNISHRGDNDIAAIGRRIGINLRLKI
jgi:outer membrane receptor for ferrienterochelin and colicin